jgi:hypothetical protein
LTFCCSLLLSTALGYPFVSLSLCLFAARPILSSFFSSPLSSVALPKHLILGPFAGIALLSLLIITSQHHTLGSLTLARHLFLVSWNLSSSTRRHISIYILL